MNVDEKEDVVYTHSRQYAIDVSYLHYCQSCQCFKCIIIELVLYGIKQQLQQQHHLSSSITSSLIIIYIIIALHTTHPTSISTTMKVTALATTVVIIDLDYIE